MNLKKFLKLLRLLVPQIEQAVPGMVRVKAQFGAPRILPTSCAELKRALATNTKLKLALIKEIFKVTCLLTFTVNIGKYIFIYMVYIYDVWSIN